MLIGGVSNVAPGWLLDVGCQNPMGKPELTEASVEATLADLESALGHTFASRALLERALTHRSLANEKAVEQRTTGAKPIEAGLDDNERMEFLGDAVLGLVVAEALFSAHPEWHEGELTRVRALLVSREHMAEVARGIGLGSYLRLSRGEERGDLRSKRTVLSNSMEAVLGALFLDGGLEPVRRFARQYVMGEVVEQLAEELRSGAALGNFKSALQEHLQAERAGTPVYRLKSESGPDHRKRFLVEVRLRTSESERGRPLARGIGSTKKLAEQDAARLALERLTAKTIDLQAEESAQRSEGQEEE
jgi:ribonuclease-3